MNIADKDKLVEILGDCGFYGEVDSLSDMTEKLIKRGVVALPVRPGQRVQWLGDGCNCGYIGTVKSVQILGRGFYFLIKFDMGTTFLASDKDIEREKIVIFDEIVSVVNSDKRKN